jgi:DNA-binding transcriptional MerR regulator
MAHQGEFFEVPSEEVTMEKNDMTSSDRDRQRRGLLDSGIPKLYRSISEVSAMAGVEQYILRYWETEFNELRPQKNRAGNRIYSERDVKLILRIKELLREQRYTIEGAKRILHEEREQERKSAEEPKMKIKDESQLHIIPPPPPTTVKLDRSSLQEIRDALVSIRKRLA